MFKYLGLRPVQVLWPALPRPVAPTVASRHLSSKPNNRGSQAPKKTKRSKALAKTASDIADEQTQEMERSIWRKQFVLDNYDIPGRYQKFFTGRLRNREANRYKRQLEQTKEATDKVPRVGARAVTMDEEVQHKRVEAMRSLVLRILERHLSSGQLPVRQLSMQYWEITDVLVSFNLKTAICCYKITAKDKEEPVKPFQIRKVIRESTAYLNMVVNQELNKTRGRPRAVNLKFVSGSATARLMEMLEADVRQSEGE
ncbi:hypothetical protein IWW37_005224 [Coemansia sp. RSA 2050]|nr:hypothetical protein IWW37_005224 [Coemansia sp. RSA 2050]KAJ2731541.1 hypothetical protein IW152_004458 [Coemansia sp. BCRC 34962]